MDVLTERTANIYLDDDDDEDYGVEDNDDAEQEPPSAVSSSKRMSVSMSQSSSSRRLKSKPKSRRRRRSSARFLKLASGDNDNEENEDMLGTTAGGSAFSTRMESLGEVYQNAIRMNAENRINASNSWNLNLIDHMDRFVMHHAADSGLSSAPMEDTLGPLTGVNFTKASCTLDASVKIYSYRVDDVHLTSYKVLANLNRTDNGKSKSHDNNGKDATNDNGGEVVGTANGGGGAAKAREERRAARNNAETLESNLANINIHKLDAAFDIDPLFHKMSKTFDEGGAKGLLLANLGVSEKGCNIVFDSTLENSEETKTATSDNEDGDESAASTTTSTALLDVSTLVARLESALNGQTIHHLPLVPQLAALRSEFVQLKEEGFVEKVKPSNRYAAPKEDEAEADRSIHVEAIERSRASQAELGRSLMASRQDDDSFLSGGDDDDDGGYAPVDFGGDDDEDFDTSNVAGGGGGDGLPVSFIHDGDHRYSSASFQTTFEASQPPSQASLFLDAIAAGDISGSQSNYEYFNKKALESMIQANNQWAGAAHWKKMQPKRAAKTKTASGGDKDETTAKATKKRKGRATKKKTGNKAKSTVTFIDVTKPMAADIKDVLKKPPKGKRGSTPLQMTDAAIVKATDNENILPMDVGIKVENFTSLFLRPNINVRDLVAASVTSQSAALAGPARQVGFGGVETWGDNHSYGDDGDDDGYGFAFGGGDHDDVDDFVVPALEGVRKVDKVQVGYATVAKKVDVKRLKKDLWDELERTFQQRRGNGSTEKEDAPNNCVNVDNDDEAMNVEAQGEAMEEQMDETTNESSSGGTAATNPPMTALSFQDTVREMQATQQQADVTLPFYFICILHLANEKGLSLESTGLDDFIIKSS